MKRTAKTEKEKNLSTFNYKVQPQVVMQQADTHLPFSSLDTTRKASF